MKPIEPTTPEGGGKYSIRRPPAKSKEEFHMMLQEFEKLTGIYPSGELY